ncbi:MAG: GrpB family protein, partial [bacterium]|nr:GrpB family protein [bacterium]
LIVAIENLDDWDWIKEPLSKLGYEFRRDFRQKQGHVLFVKGSKENRTHYLKVTELNSDFWNEHVLFRDYLINNPKYRQEYQKLKEQMLEEHKGERGPYTKGKEEFVKKILKLAGFKGKIL